MINRNTGLAGLGRLLPRATMLAAMMALPLMAVQGVRAGDETIIIDSQQISSGAGLVLMVSLKRAR